MERTASTGIADKKTNETLSFRTVIILHAIGLLLMVVGSEFTNNWTATLTNTDLGDVKGSLEEWSSSPLTLVLVGVIPIGLRIWWLMQPNPQESKEKKS